MCQQRFVYFHDALNQHVGVNFHEITVILWAREIQVSRKGDTMQGDLDMGGYEGKRDQYAKNL